MKKILLLITLFMLSVTGYAFHIVGGEIELVHVNGFIYDLNLIQYFDRAQTDNPNPEGVVTVVIYRNSDDQPVETFVLSLVSEIPVNYTNNECALDELITSRVLFNNRVSLDPDLYSDPEGYYVVWERCCRNAGIVNIINPLGTGMTYVLDFPPLFKDGERFINSSPTLLPPLSDYACVNQLYYTDFRGTDLDGDSLTYEIVVPLNSSAAVPVPAPSSRLEHFPVTLAPGISRTNLIPGSRNLSITNTGFLTVQPENPGLYVFSVLVKEFRNGEEIGKVKRDFQMLVIDGCLPPDPPRAVVQLPGDPTLYEDEAFVSYTVSEEKCFDFLIGNIGPMENARVRVRPVNFSGNVNGFTFTETPITADSSIFRVCVPECPLKLDEPYVIDLIALDNACPLPQQDTVRLTIDVEPPPNEKPVFRGISDDRVAITVNENELFRREFDGDDIDLDFLTLAMIGTDFNPADAGITFSTVSNEEGTVKGVFEWNTDCDIFDFTETNTFEVALVLEDLDFCEIPGDTLFLDLTVQLPFNSDPEITSTLTETTIQTLPDNVISFSATATDLDNDELNFRLIGEGFNPSDVGVSFDDKTGRGSLTSDFTWDLDCQDIDFSNGANFKFYLIADDNDRCRVKNFDTLAFEIGIVERFNNKPEFLTVDAQDLRVNEPFRIDVNADDLDVGDLISIDLLPGFLPPPGPGFSFTPGEGFGSATGTIEWTPPCQLLGRSFASRDFNLFLLASDNSCPTPKYDTIEVNLTVRNLPVEFERFEPPNVFSPNGDGKNDTFTLTGHEEDAFNLPLDNCQESFQYMTVVDRSGREIFRTEDRDFTWDGLGASAGVYFYFIKYTTTEFRGSVTLVN